MLGCLIAYKLLSWPSTKTAFETILSRQIHTSLEVAQCWTLTNMSSAVKRSSSLYAFILSWQHGPASLYHEVHTKKGCTTTLGEGVLMKN